MNITSLRQEGLGFTAPCKMSLYVQVDLTVAVAYMSTNQTHAHRDFCASGEENSALYVNLKMTICVVIIIHVCYLWPVS